MEQENNIFDHLKPKKGSTPDASYFDNMAESILGQEKDIFNHIKPKTEATPDASYFEELAKLTLEHEKPKTKVIPLYKKPLFWLIASAASIALLLLVYPTSVEEDNTTLLAMNDFSKEEIINYVDENIEEFDTYLFSQYLTDEIIEEDKTIIYVEMETVESEKIEELEEIELDDILEYFEYEEIDIDELEDDLYI